MVSRKTNNHTKTTRKKTIRFCWGTTSSNTFLSSPFVFLNKCSRDYKNIYPPRKTFEPNPPHCSKAISWYLLQFISIANFCVFPALTQVCTKMANSTPFSEPESAAEGYPNLPPYVEPTLEVAFEPLPHWDQAKETWQWTWDLHWAGLGSMFALLALYALWSLIDLAGRKYRRKPLLAMTISSLLFTFGCTRALFLFINPYESEQCFLPTDCPVALTRTLFGIALPCITASFFLVHLGEFPILRGGVFDQEWKFCSWFFRISLGEIP